MDVVVRGICWVLCCWILVRYPYVPLVYPPIVDLIAAVVLSNTQTDGQRDEKCCA